MTHSRYAGLAALVGVDPDLGPDYDPVPPCATLAARWDPSWPDPPPARCSRGRALMLVEIAAVLLLGLVCVFLLAVVP